MVFNRLSGLKVAKTSHIALQRNIYISYERWNSRMNLQHKDNKSFSFIIFKKIVPGSSFKNGTTKALTSHPAERSQGPSHIHSGVERRAHQ